jgi:hypothetical protein
MRGRDHGEKRLTDAQDDAHIGAGLRVESQSYIGASLPDRANDPIRPADLNRKGDSRVLVEKPAYRLGQEMWHQGFDGTDANVPAPQSVQSVELRGQALDLEGSVAAVRVQQLARSSKRNAA